MKIGAIAQNPFEFIALKSGQVPTPLAYSHFGFMMSKTVLEATDAGVFEALKNGPLTVDALAGQLGLNARALGTVLGVLATMDLIDPQGGTVALTKLARKWMLKDSPDSAYWMMLFDNRICMGWMDRVGEFLRTGKGLQYHETFDKEQWRLYQNAMAAAAAGTAKEAVKKISVPAGAQDMLDIGGSHGYYSVQLCRNHPGLRSTILELPQAIAEAAPLLAAQGMGERVKHLPGNVLMDDLGTERYDLIIMASVAHHFTDEQNREVARKAYRALRPGGRYCVLEFLRQEHMVRKGDMLGAFGDFFFALSSTVGLWSAKEIAGHLEQAGFQDHRIARFLTIPGYAVVQGRK